MNTNNHINYIEFKAPDLDAIKTFYSHCFGWSFTDYGAHYTAFENSGIAGGFEKSDDKIVTVVLVVLYNKKLKTCKEKIVDAGGIILKDIFSFPGGGADFTLKILLEMNLRFGQTNDCLKLFQSANNYCL